MFTLRYLKKYRRIAIVLTILIAIEIFYFSSIPSLPENPIKEIDLATIYHLIIFFLLSFFFLTSIKGTNKLKPKYLIFTMFVMVIYAVSDEIHQIFVPGRFPNIKDVLIDFLGSLIAIVIYPKKSQ